jgi:hypothetical protein
MAGSLNVKTKSSPKKIHTAEQEEKEPPKL